METLDDKSTDGKSNNEMKNVALDDKKDVERQETEESTNWREILITYRLAFSMYTLTVIFVRDLRGNF